MSDSINRLSQGDWSTAAQIPFYDAPNGQNRKGSVNELIDLIQSQITEEGANITQYATPISTDLVIVSPPTEGSNVFLRLTPAGTLASLGIRVPDNPIDGQEVLVKSTQTLTALTVSTATSGHTISGGPTTLAANGFFRMRFDGVFKAWDRVG